MKEAIVGYITALIDTHQTEAEIFKKLNNGFNYDERFVKELEQLLEFVIDIPGGEKTPKEHSKPGANNITVNMVKPENLPDEVKKAIKSIVNGNFNTR